MCMEGRKNGWMDRWMERTRKTCKANAAPSTLCEGSSVIPRMPPYFTFLLFLKIKVDSGYFELSIKTWNFSYSHSSHISTPSSLHFKALLIYKTQPSGSGFPSMLWGQGQSELHRQSPCAAGCTAEAQSAQSISCPVTVKDDPTLTQKLQDLLLRTFKDFSMSLSAFSLSFFFIIIFYPPPFILFILSHAPRRKRVGEEKIVLQVTFLSTLVAFKPTMSPSDTEQKSGSSVTWSWNCWPWQILSPKERTTAGRFWGQLL